MIFKLLLCYFAVVSLVLFIVMGADKRAAEHGRRRVPERTLLGIAAIGGSVGGILGMIVFRHKIRKPAFFIGYPAMLLLHAVIAYFIYKV